MYVCMYVYISYITYHVHCPAPAQCTRHRGHLLPAAAPPPPPAAAAAAAAPPPPPDENRGLAVEARTGVDFAAPDDDANAADAADEAEVFAAALAGAAVADDDLASASVCSVAISSRMRRESSKRRSSCNSASNSGTQCVTRHTSPAAAVSCPHHST
jgi:hypothetical protein